jgi:hypothetical protein
MLNRLPIHLGMACSRLFALLPQKMHDCATRLPYALGMLAALSATDKATIALAIVTGLLALVALLQLFAFNRSEGRRTQAVAVLNQEHGREVDTFRFGVSITNHGVGTAFNVRVGVRLDGIEFPLGQDPGNRYTVGQGERVPPNGDFDVEVPYWAYARPRAKPNVDSRAVFYARYENSFGKTWETLNPADPLASFKVRRAKLARFRRAHAWRQRRKRTIAERIVVRRNNEEVQSAQSRKPIPWGRRVMRRLGR